MHRHIVVAPSAARSYCWCSADSLAMPYGQDSVDHLGEVVQSQLCSTVEVTIKDSSSEIARRNLIEVHASGRNDGPTRGDALERSSSEPRYFGSR